MWMGCGRDGREGTGSGWYEVRHGWKVMREEREAWKLEHEEKKGWKEENTEVTKEGRRERSWNGAGMEKRNVALVRPRN